jgi:L-ascorbate metabolism protein UlaG (beta-lactamase superfamily)
MVKRISSIVGIILLAVVILGIIIFESTYLRNLIFYKSGLTPSDVFNLNDKINSSSVFDTSNKRIGLFNEIDTFMKNSVNGKGFSMKPYDLVKVRLDQALAEIPQTQVPKGKIKIWYIYNMGVIIKSADKTIAFDLASSSVYSNMKDFTKYIDILIISHYHNDHFDLPVVKEALKDGVTVIGPDDKVILANGQFIRSANGEGIISLIKKRNRISSENFMGLTPLIKTTVEGVEITAYPANHMYNPETDPDPNSAKMPLNWYYVNIDGKTILFAGDSNNLDYQPDFSNKKVDIFIEHYVDPKTTDDFLKLVPNAGLILPLHVYELLHGSGITEFMSYKNMLEEFSNGYLIKGGAHIRFMPMIWGESFEL